MVGRCFPCLSMWVARHYFLRSYLLRAPKCSHIMGDNAERLRPPPNRRRDKVQLSCDPCRHRKYVLDGHHEVVHPPTINVARLKCDRQHPCGACSRRGRTVYCNYATTTPSLTPDARSVAPPQPTSLHDRISELEGLVTTLVQGHLPPSPFGLSGNIPADNGELGLVVEPKKSQGEAASRADPGTLSLGESGKSYVQSVHWEAILTKLRGLKDDSVADSKVSSGSHFFYGPNRHATRDEILAAVPPRPVVDRLMALHFDSHVVTPCQYIHACRPLSEALTLWCRSHS